MHDPDVPPIGHPWWHAELEDLDALFGGDPYPYGFEKNRPATFKHPLWSLAGDYKMVALMLAGRMDEEVAREHASRTEPSPQTLLPRSA